MGQLTAILAKENDYLAIDSEDLHSAFNLFRMSKTWALFFSFGKKVRGDALGGSTHEKLRLALAVVPMGWTSAVTLIQAAIRHIAYSIAKIPRQGDINKDDPLPDVDDLTVLYLDNFDELPRLRKEIAESQQGSLSGKQLAGALRGTLQGGEILGRQRILRHAYDKSREFVDISFGLLSSDHVTNFSIRHWAGKAAFAATFRRPLLAIPP